MELARTNSFKTVFRVALAVLLFPAYVLSTSAIVDSIASSSISMLIAMANGFIVTFIVASLAEWAVHRYVCHTKAFRNIYEWHRQHHEMSPLKRERPQNDFHEAEMGKQQSTSFKKNILPFCLYMGLGVTTLWIPTAIASGSSGFFLGIVAGTFSVSSMLVVGHHRIHHPRSSPNNLIGNWFSKSERYHWRHHRDGRTNFNLLIPLADWIFGTYQAEYQGRPGPPASFRNS